MRARVPGGLERWRKAKRKGVGFEVDFGGCQIRKNQSTIQRRDGTWRGDGGEGWRWGVWRNWL